MHLWIVLLASLLSFSAFSAPSRPSEITRKLQNARAVNLQDARFDYESFEGDWKYPCKAELESDHSPYDLKVRCYDGERLIRKFSVHLALRTYQRPVEPRTTIEIMYWVNGEGTTAWIHLTQPTKMQEFEASQSIAGEPVGLRLKVKLP